MKAWYRSGLAWAVGRQRPSCGLARVASGFLDLELSSMFLSSTADVELARAWWVTTARNGTMKLT